jgi:hypothetical protein
VPVASRLTRGLEPIETLTEEEDTMAEQVTTIKYRADGTDEIHLWGRYSAATNDATIEAERLMLVRLPGVDEAWIERENR